MVFVCVTRCEPLHYRIYILLWYRKCLHNISKYIKDSSRVTSVLFYHRVPLHPTIFDYYVGTCSIYINNLSACNKTVNSRVFHRYGSMFGSVIGNLTYNIYILFDNNIVFLCLVYLFVTNKYTVSEFRDTFSITDP